MQNITNKNTPATLGGIPSSSSAVALLLSGTTTDCIASMLGGWLAGYFVHAGVMFVDSVWRCWMCWMKFLLNVGRRSWWNSLARFSVAHWLLCWPLLVFVEFFFLLLLVFIFYLFYSSCSPSVSGPYVAFRGHARTRYTQRRLGCTVGGRVLFLFFSKTIHSLVYVWWLRPIEQFTLKTHSSVCSALYSAYAARIPSNRISV